MAKWLAILLALPVMASENFTTITTNTYWSSTNIWAELITANNERAEILHATGGPTTYTTTVVEVGDDVQSYKVIGYINEDLDTLRGLQRRLDLMCVYFVDSSLTGSVDGAEYIDSDQFNFTKTNFWISAGIDTQGWYRLTNHGEPPGYGYLLPGDYITVSNLTELQHAYSVLRYSFLDASAATSTNVEYYGDLNTEVVDGYGLTTNSTSEAGTNAGGLVAASETQWSAESWRSSIGKSPVDCLFAGELGLWSNSTPEWLRSERRDRGDHIVDIEDDDGHIASIDHQFEVYYRLRMDNNEADLEGWGYSSNAWAKTHTDWWGSFVDTVLFTAKHADAVMQLPAMSLYKSAWISNAISSNAFGASFPQQEAYDYKLYQPHILLEWDFSNITTN